MSIRLMSEIWKSAKDVKSERLIVLLALADWANDDGYCWPKMDTIAEKARTSKDGASRIVAWLEEAGYLTIERGTGRGNNSTYTVHAEPVERQDETETETDKGRCTKGDSKSLKGDPETERAILKRIKGDPEKSHIYSTRAGLTISEPSIEPSRSVSARREEFLNVPDIESPLAKAIRKVCKKGLVLSPNDADKLRTVLHGLKAEGATVEQVEEYGRKVSRHWTGIDKQTKNPRPPGIMQVLEYWHEVLAMSDEENSAVKRVDPKRIDALTERINRHKAATAAQ